MIDHDLSAKKQHVIAAARTDAPLMLIELAILRPREPFALLPRLHARLRSPEARYGLIERESTKLPTKVKEVLGELLDAALFHTMSLLVDVLDR